MLLNNCVSRTYTNNLKTNNYKVDRVGFNKHEEGNKPKLNTPKIGCILGVKLEELSQAIILFDHHNNPVLARAAKTMLQLQCDTVVKGPKSEKQLKRQIFNFTIKLDTGKNQFEFNFDVKGNEFMADDTQLYNHLITTSTRHGFVYEFDCANLASILVVDVPSDLAKHYGHTNLSKAIASLQKKAEALHI